MTGCSWMWMYIGAFLMLAELLAPGFVIFFFGLSAISVGILRALFGEAFTVTWQLAAFSFFSVVYLAVLRRWIKSVFSGGSTKSADDFSNEYIGRTGKVVADINPPLEGRVEIGDSQWTASADIAIAAGSTVKVTAQSNLTFKVEPL